MQLCLFGAAASLSLAVTPFAPVYASNAEDTVTVTKLSSPFSNDGDAVLIVTPANRGHVLSWSSDKISPGNIYSLSFFFQQAENVPSKSRPIIQVRAYDDGKHVFSQNLHPSSTARFYVDSLVFNTPRAAVTLTFPPGQAVIVGDVGRCIWASNLRPPSYRGKSPLWPVTVRLPSIYRGLRKFRIKTLLSSRASDPRSTQPLRVERIIASAQMKVSTAKLPRLLPGAATLTARYSEARPGASLDVQIRQRNLPDVARLDVKADSAVPADGATFGRVFISAVDRRGHLVAGLFVRLKCPPGIRSFPYTKAIIDAPRQQYLREIHVLSTTPGDYAIPIEIWDGTRWSLADECVRITFHDDRKEQFPEYRRSDYARPWLEPRPIASLAAMRTDNIDAVLRGRAQVLRIPTAIESKLMPACSWTVTGPVSDLGLFADFQPDPRTLRSLGESLRALTHASGQAATEEDLALAIEEYVNLCMEGYRPEDFDSRWYPSAGRTHREGRGWCADYARAVYVLALESGLEATMDNTNDHVLGKVRGQSLQPIVLDALLQVGLCSATGKRGDLSTIDTPDKRILGIGVNKKSRRGTSWKYYEEIVHDSHDWQKKEPNKFICKLADSDVLSFDLRAWERMEWSSGHADNRDVPRTIGLLGVHQTVLT